MLLKKVFELPQAGTFCPENKLKIFHIIEVHVWYFLKWDMLWEQESDR